MAAALPVIFIAAQVVGTAVQAFSQFSSAQQTARAERFNAQVAENNAQIARNAAADRARQARRAAEIVNAEGEAQVGASGVTTEGSPLLVFLDNAAQGELAARRELFTGEAQARQQEDQASLARFRSRSASSAAPLLAGSTLLTGFGRAGISLSKFLKPGEPPIEQQVGP